GYTDASGYNVVTSALKDGRRVVGVVIVLNFFTNLWNASYSTFQEECCMVVARVFGKSSSEAIQRENDRLAVLQQLDILDTPRDEGF
ncbi:hypothetical protein AB9F45_36725, partial [Rhizobium leguminosarum]|uniref:hypothetical protein n=1 Tax=Rhizobium leguminosarum TaxID=384 RepID=UPI003F955082